MSRRNITILSALTAILLASAPAALASEKAAVDAWAKAWTTGVDNLDSFLTEDVTFKDPYYSKNDRQGYREASSCAPISSTLSSLPSYTRAEGRAMTPRREAKWRAN